MSNNKIDITDQNFEEKVLKNSKLTLVDFWAEWCGPCKALGPVIDELAEEIKDVDFCKCNIDKNPETPSKYAVRSIPTLILFNKGEVVDTKVGAVSKEVLRGWIKEYNK